ncbi:MAG: ABC transporter permease [Lachnospiraceae bacterium]|nr:ABC transporter permease [Candidatus Merdinaster equi]
MNKFHFDRKHLTIPYLLYLAVFVVVPLLVVIYYGFTDSEGHISFTNFVAFFCNTKTMGTLLYSLVLAIIVTIICLLLAYPVAYILAKGEYSRKHSFLMVFVLPMWINFTLRVTALKEILTLLEGNLAFHPFLNTVIGMVYDFLPFMIMPLYNALTKLDNSMIEASRDLGANGRQTFLKVILPLSVPGIISGITMVFLPAMTNYVVLDMVYNSTYIMGSLIGSYFSSYDWNNGSLISAVLLILIGLFTILTNRMAGDKDSRERGRV